MCLWDAARAFPFFPPSNPMLDPDSDDTDFESFVRRSFAPECPFGNASLLVESARNLRWFPENTRNMRARSRPASDYIDLWSRSSSYPVEELVSDAAIHCIEHWSANACLDFIEHALAEPRELNSLLIVTGMLQLSLIWPESR